MSNCNICGKSFGFWNKELGCPLCNKVFCKKCLVYKVPCADNPKKTILVCLRCSKIQENPSIAKKEIGKKHHVEELLEVKPEEFESPILEPSTSDDHIRNRIDELKKNENSSFEDQNIEQRLANLKGIDFKEKTTDKIIFSTDTRSEQQKIDDLLKQFVEEKEINDQYTQPSTDSQEQPGSVDDIERRLALLRGVDVSKIKTQIPEYKEETEQEETEQEETEQEEIDRTIMQYLEEAKLPDLGDEVEKEFLNSIPKPANKKDIEELPFCEICNEDAVIRCLDCENIFCHRCFLEFHDEEDYKTHKTKPYEAKKESKE